MSHDGSARAESAPRYLDTADAVGRFIEAIAHERLIAIDTEGASFHRFVDRIYLLQISTRDRTAVIDPLPIGVPTALGVMLEDPAVEIVLHDADYDLRLLQRDYGWSARNIFDTRIAAQLLGLRAFGLAALLERFLGVKIEKKFQRADWSMRPLTAGMLEYAAQDTINLLALRDRLRSDLLGMGRWDWAAEEFERLEGTRWAEDTGDAFLRMKGARDLTRRELAILRELVAWRDDVARAADRAAFRVLGNDPLFEIARLKPSSRDELSRVKGMPRGVLEARSDDVLAAVRRGIDVPDADLPRFQRGTRWDRDPNFEARTAALKTIRDEVATELDLDPGVLCSRERLEAVARRNPANMAELGEVRELRRWQAAVLGSRFIVALERYGSPQRPAAIRPV
ncbi:MAG TPA: HRDC domain-containing protein [Gemmatimonadaceae bacterium]|nr:HRDC domain-containing protein [Gemmatimonadaceae bacterium]